MARRTQPRATAWLPSSPATLFVLDEISDTSGVKSQYFLSDDGVGCNDHEVSALMHILSAHQDYFCCKPTTDPRPQQRSSWSRLRSLSQSYRLALNECLRGWEQELEEEEENAEKKNVVVGENDDHMEVEDDNKASTTKNDNLSFELLKLAVPVMHLAEIFVLLPTKDQDTTVEHHKEITSTPGALTADTVRYLRLHHMKEVYAIVAEDLDMDITAIEQILNSMQPDQVGEGLLYWKLIKTMVLRGCLEEAWALLSRHSLCRTCFDETLEDYHSVVRKQDRQGFYALRSILLSAPLPGGRSSEYDVDCGERDDDDDDDDKESREGMRENMLEGIPISAYKLWESGKRLDADDGDYPVSFQPQTARTMHQNWMHYVRELQTLHYLKHRVPQLQTILSTLAGDLTHVTFDSWAEALCAELLYVRPDIRPSDVSTRTAHFISEYGPPTQFNDVVLSIMAGNAGRAIRTMQDLGGRYGAALPATITALLCSLLCEAKVLPTDEAETASIQTELLLSASFAILSALALTKPDIGVRLSTNLLLPYCKPGGDLCIVATVAETLERHVPQSDSEAQTLIDQCKILIQQKSVRVLDGCVNLCLCRYRQYLTDQRPGGAMHWLLQGLQLEELVYGKDHVDIDASDDDNNDNQKWEHLSAASTCYGILVTWCLKTSDSLLKLLLGENDSTTLLVREIAGEMVASIATTASMKRDDEKNRISGNGNHEGGDSDVMMIPEVATLKLLHEMAEAFVEKQDALVAHKIVECLEEKVNDNDGIVSTLAHTSLHWNLLRLAVIVLHSDEQSHISLFESSFDVHGMQTLLTRLTLVLLAVDGIMEDNPTAEHPQQQATRQKVQHEMREAFGTGLARAIVSENRKRKPKNDATGKTSDPLDGFRSVNLGRYSLEDQEKAVARMLDY